MIHLDIDDDEVGQVLVYCSKCDCYMGKMIVGENQLVNSTELAKILDVNRVYCFCPECGPCLCEECSNSKFQVDNR